MTLQIYAGLTSQTVRFFIQDTSSTSGAGLTGLTSATSGLTAYYSKGGTGSATAITLASQTATGAWTSGGFCAVDGTNMPGVYRLDIPNAALDSEVETIIMLRGAASMAPVCLRVTGRVFASDGVKWGGAAVTGMPMPTYTQPAGFLAATFPATVSSYAGGAVASVTGSVGSVTAAVTVGTNNDKTGYSLATAPPTAAAIANVVWDEILTGATHNIQNSAGKRLRTLASQVVHSGTAQGPGTGNNQIQLDTGASATNGIYDPSVIYIESGTGAEQVRLITQYVGSTRTATVNRDWRINPASDSVFVIQAFPGFNTTNEGLARGGSATTIQLNASANTNDDCYNGQIVYITSGTGQDQVAMIEDYVGSTQTATIRTRRASGQWAVVPDSTSNYFILPSLVWKISEIQSGLATSAAVSAVQTDLTTLLGRITANLFSGISYMSRWLGAIAGKTADAATQTEIRATTAGVGYTITTDSLEAIRDNQSGGGGGSGDATTANQILILDQLDLIQAKTDLISGAGGITSLLAGAVLQPGTITSFPEVITIGDSYTAANGRAIQIPVVDTNGNPVSSSGSLPFSSAAVSFTISRANETELTRIIEGVATFVDPPGTGTAEAPYVLIELLSSETIKGLKKYRYSGVLTFTWPGTSDEVVSFETDTEITFDN